MELLLITLFVGNSAAKVTLHFLLLYRHCRLSQRVTCTKKIKYETDPDYRNNGNHGRENKVLDCRCFIQLTFLLA